MAIKYHQNGIGNEYGADHQLTNNWNPDKDYGTEYVKPKFPLELYLGIVNDVRKPKNTSFLTVSPLYKSIYNRYNYI